MKFSLRILALAMLVAVLFSGGAFADVNEVAARIREYGFTAAVDGNVITVTGTVAKPKTGLDMGDISGLTIKWNATLTADVADGSFQQMQANGKMRYVLVNTLANISPATFQMIGGKISLNDSNPSANIPQGYPNSWSNTINNGGKVNVILDDGIVEMNLVEGTAISVSSEWSKITINGGKVSAPNGSALHAKEFELKDVSGITGTVENTAAKTFDVYGNFSIVCDDSATFTGEDASAYDGWVFSVKSGAKMTVAHPNMILAAPITFRVENGGTIEILKDNKLTLKCKSVEIMWTVSGNLAKSAALAVNVGTLNNAGTLALDSTANVNNKGIINNTGTVLNAGNIKNDGTITNNGIIKSDPANMTGNPVEGNSVEPVKPTPPSGGSSGGCTAAPSVAGIFALLLVPFMLKKRK